MFFCCFQTFWIAQKGKCITVSIFNELICLLPEHHYLLVTVLLKPIKASPLYRAGIRVANFDLIYGLLFFLEQPRYKLLAPGKMLHCSCSSISILLILIFDYQSCSRFLFSVEGLLGEGLCLIPDQCRSDTSLQSVA